MMDETKEPISMKKINIRYVIHLLLTFLFATGVAWFSNEIILEHAWNDNYFLFTGVLLAVIALCSFLERKKLYGSVRTIGVLTACFVVSGLLLLLSDYYINLPIWLIGGIVAAALANRNMGMLYLYFFVFHAIYLQGNLLNGLIFHFVISTLICIFIPKMKTFLSMFYMMAFAACLVVTGSIINNQMYIEQSMMLDTFYILCTYLGCILVTMLLVKWVGEKKPAETVEAEVPGNYEYLDLLAQDTAVKDEEVKAAVEEQAAVEAVPEEESVAEEAVGEETASEEIVTEQITEEIVAEEPVTEEPAVEEPVAEEQVVEETVTEEAGAESVIEEQAAEENVEELVAEEIVAEESVTEEPAVEEPATEEQIAEEPAKAEPVPEIDYTPFCNEKAELLMELRAKNKSAYAQAVLVGKFAYETAKTIGLNAELTKAGGLYKRIGKIRENSNEYTSTEVAKEHQFPEPLIYLLDQLNHDIIEQKEAAVLLMTDEVVSYYSIVRRAQKNDIVPEKIVDNIIYKKMFQGEFNESGLSMQEGYILREKLIALLKNQDKKRIERETERKNQT